MGLETTLSNPQFQQNAINKVGSTTAKASKAAKGAQAANAANVIAIAAEIATGIATTIASVRDERMRTNFQQNLQLLSNEQQLALATALNRANNETERLKILGLALTDLSKQRINNLQEVIAQQEKNRRNKLVTTAIQVSALFIVGGVVVYYLSKK